MRAQEKDAGKGAGVCPGKGFGFYSNGFGKPAGMDQGCNVIWFTFFFFKDTNCT